MLCNELYDIGIFFFHRPSLPPRFSMQASLVKTFAFGLILSLLIRADSSCEAQVKKPKKTPVLPSGVELIADIEFAKPNDHALLLDLYRPVEFKGRLPVVVFVHGGGWKNGSRKSAGRTAAWLAAEGFAVVGISYRLTDVAQWPAQINDCYAAVRWVRDNSDKYQFDPQHVGAWGTSAGAHLVAIMGTRRFPGKETTSSQVQAVCDWFGPSELLTMPPNNVGNGRTEADIAKSNGAKLLGATVRDVPAKAKDASGLDHVSDDDPAFLIMHGDKDPGVPIEQSYKLHKRLQEAGVYSKLHVVKGAAHGGKLFSTPESKAVVRTFFNKTLRPQWAQGSGPTANFHLQDVEAPTTWSVVHDENIRWKVTLPETGQSTVIVHGDRLFFTTLKEVTEDSDLGQDIVAWCCSTETGKTIWKREIAGEHPLRLSGCFSDSSSPPPVTDGRRVCFFNASGTIKCFDLDGREIWTYKAMAVGRAQPFLTQDGSIVFIKQTYMPDGKGHFTHEHKDAPVKQWTQLQAVNIKTGKVRWTSQCGSNMGCVPVPHTLSDGRNVILVGRGGGHSPPEKPEGVSMIDARDGSTLWTLALPGFMSTMTLNIANDQALIFHAGDHLWVDTATGKITRRVSFVEDVTVKARIDAKFQTRKETVDIGKKTRAIIQQSNVLVGDYHYFRSYTKPWLGRIHVKTGAVEFLQLPVQIVREPEATDIYLWTAEDVPKPVKPAVADPKPNRKRKPSGLPITKWMYRPNDMKNSRGFVVMGDARSKGNGWGHHASAIPTAIGDYLYVPVMTGTVYVIDWKAKALDEKAIVAINDLGRAGESWTRSSISWSNGRLFARTIRELICIGETTVD
jgi:acetyl esterase/lipase